MGKLRHNLDPAKQLTTDTGLLQGLDIIIDDLMAANWVLEATYISNAKDQIEWLRDMVEDLVAQGCTDREDPTKLDSLALRTYAEALRYLAKLGRVKIEHEVGRRVIARWEE